MVRPWSQDQGSRANSRGGHQLLKYTDLILDLQLPGSIQSVKIKGLTEPQLDYLLN